MLWNACLMRWVDPLSFLLAICLGKNWWLWFICYQNTKKKNNFNQNKEKKIRLMSTPTKKNFPSHDLLKKIFVFQILHFGEFGIWNYDLMLTSLNIFIHTHLGHMNCFSLRHEWIVDGENNSNIATKHSH